MLELDGDRVARLRTTSTTPSFIADLGAELGVPMRINGHRWWTRRRVMKRLLLAARRVQLAAPPAIATPPQRGTAHYADIGPLHMYYEDTRHTAAPVVLLHGGGSTAQTSFGQIIPALARAHRVIAPEEQAHGHTPDVARPLSFEQMADDTAALLEQLHIANADILGFSNGGMIALAARRAAPRARP